MGNVPSSGGKALPSGDLAVLNAICEEKSYSADQPVWSKLFGFSQPLHAVIPHNFTLAAKDLCQKLAFNNAMTNNFSVLLHHLVLVLQRSTAAAVKSSKPVGQPESKIPLVNALFLTRVFIKYVIEEFGPQELLKHCSPGPPAPSTPSGDICTELVRALLAILIHTQPEGTYYDLHLEAVNTLLVLLSTQLFQPLDKNTIAGDGTPQPTSDNRFLDILMAIGREHLEEGKSTSIGEHVVRNLLLRYLEQVSPNSQTMPDVMEATEAANASLNIDYDAEKEKGEEQGGKTVATPALNPYREAMGRLVDSKVTADQLAVLYPQGGAIPISFPELTEGIAKNLLSEHVVLLLYTLMYGNSLFMKHTITTLEHSSQLVVPILRSLYQVARLRPTQSYLLVILLLTFTQESNFGEESFKKIILPQVPWIHERRLTNISLGSLMLIVLVRVILYNITKLQDSYIHLNCFAALSNLAPHSEGFHPYTAQKVVGATELLAKKLLRLHEDLLSDPPRGEDKSDIRLPTYEAYNEFLRLMLEFLNVCMNYSLLQNNPHLVYALLHGESLFKKLEALERLKPFVDKILQVIQHFQSDVEKLPDNATVEDVTKVIVAGSKSLLVGSGISEKIRRGSTEYKYEEEENPEGFFVPYVWMTTVQRTTDIQWATRKIMVFEPDQMPLTKRLSSILSLEDSETSSYDKSRPSLDGQQSEDGAPSGSYDYEQLPDFQVSLQRTADKEKGHDGGATATER